MIHPGTIVWFCIVIAVGYAMFQVKYEVMQQEQTLASLNKQITDGREQIRVLNAEWSYLAPRAHRGAQRALPPPERHELGADPAAERRARAPRPSAS